MASRADCDALYQSVGFARFDARIPRRVVQRAVDDSAASMSVSAQQMVLRCADMAELFDMDEYFEISEHATSDAARTMLCDPARVCGVYLLRPGTNTQRPLELWLIPAGGYCYRKYMADAAYQVCNLRELRQDLLRMAELCDQISNLPEEIVVRIFKTGIGFVLIKRPVTAVTAATTATPATTEWHTVLRFPPLWSESVASMMFKVIPSLTLLIPPTLLQPHISRPSLFHHASPGGHGNGGGRNNKRSQRHGPCLPPSPRHA